MNGAARAHGNCFLILPFLRQASQTKVGGGGQGGRIVQRLHQRRWPLLPRGDNPTENPLKFREDVDESNRKRAVFADESDVFHSCASGVGGEGRGRVSE